MLPDTAAGQPALACGNCDQAMQHVPLTGHYGQRVDLDICGHCHLIWFDSIEAARLTGAALLELIGLFAQLQSEPHNTLRPRFHCPRCRGGLKTVHNQSRFGRSLQQECLQQHGAYQSFSQFLSEKGLVRPMSLVDRAALLKQNGRLHCLNCGADIGMHDESCSYCGTQPGIFDVARLARALDPEGATGDHAVHRAKAHHARRECLACGAPMQQDNSVQCMQCGATLAISRLADAHAQVKVLAQALTAHAHKPVAHVIEKRLEAMSGGLKRQRDWTHDMEADTARSRYDDTPSRLRTGPVEIAFFIGAALLLWWLWR